MDQSLCSIMETDNIPDGIRKYIPDFEFILYDFSPLSDARIKGGVKLTLFLEILKAIFYKDPEAFMAVVKKSFTVMEELADKTRGIDYLEALIRYVMSARSDVAFEDIYRAVKDISPEGSEIVMTIAEKLVKEGMEKGMEKGALGAKAETAVKQLTKKFGTLPEELISKIQQADADTLNRILDSIFDLTSLQDVAGCFKK